MPLPPEGSTVTSATIRNDDLPIYESLVRERGDVLAEIREAADRMHQQANDLLD